MTFVCGVLSRRVALLGPQADASQAEMAIFAEASRAEMAIFAEAVCPGTDFEIADAQEQII